MRILRISMLLLILLTLTLAGCRLSQPTEEDSAPLDPQTPQLEETLTNTAENPLQLNNTPEALDMTPVSPDEDELISLAKQNLADRLKIGMDQISLLKTMEITWADISKGCSPGTDTILSKGSVTGYRVWLQAESEEYIYHIGLNRQLFLCPKSIPGANNPLLMTPGGSTQIPSNQSP